MNKRQEILSLASLCIYFNISEGYLVAAAGLNPNAMSRYKRGIRTPSDDTLENLTRTFVKLAGLHDRYVGMAAWSIAREVIV